MKYIIASFLMITISFQAMAQDINKEIGFIYTKAKYLLETERIEDAVKELNKVIKKKPDYEDAILLRAEAKYVLGAYKGVKNDLDLYISKKGITARVARLYGLCDYQGGNKKAAMNSISLALFEIKNDKKLYELRAEMHEENGDKKLACGDYQKAAKLGSNLSKRKVKSICGHIYKEGPKKSKEMPDKGSKGQDDKNDGPQNDPSSDPSGDDRSDPKSSDDDKNEEVEVVVEETEVIDTEEPAPQTDEDEDDGSINEIVVDEELTLLISGGNLGRRDVMRQPNILILADQSGTVSIDVCVSKGGRITSAIFNNQLSTIKKQSLVSLAVRKSKEFWFEKSGNDDSCGTITFKIKGTED